MKLKTIQFRYSGDNLGYLIHGKRHAVAVDGGAVAEILEYIEENGLELLFVTSTHSHGDHTCGNEGLLSATGAELIAVASLPERKRLILEGEQIRIIPTPGHTMDSLCLHHGSDLLTGDTLFNGKIGRCFTGDTEGFYRSILRLMGLPTGTSIYAGHDYLLEYLDDAEKLEPDNRLIQIYREGYDPRGVLTSTLGWEKKVNPFLRFNRKSIIQMLLERGLPAETEYERFSSMLTLM